MAPQHKQRQQHQEEQNKQQQHRCQKSRTYLVHASAQLVSCRHMLLLEAACQEAPSVLYSCSTQPLAAV